MRRLLPLIAVVPLAASCGGSSGPDETPAACLAGPAAFRQALTAAPDAVALAGSTPISECLPADQAPGDQETVGAALIRTATLLNADARANPGGAETVALGYLVGAVQAGAGTGGIHADLVRRVEAAARFDAGSRLSPRFDLAYARGYATGRARG